MSENQANYWNPASPYKSFKSVQDDPLSNIVLEAIRTDSLHALERQIKRDAERSILTAAKLIAPVIEDNFTAGKQIFEFANTKEEKSIDRLMYAMEQNLIGENSRITNQ